MTETSGVQSYTRSCINRACANTGEICTRVGTTTVSDSGHGFDSFLQ